MSEEDLIAPAAIEEEAIAETAETPETTAPETKEHDADPAEKAQKGVQKRISRLVREREQAKARADYLERLLQERQPQTQPERKEPKPLTRDQFASDDEYVDARAEAKALALLEKIQAENQMREQASKLQTIEQKREKIFSDAEALGDGDFDRDSFANVRITPVMAEAILDSDVAAKLVYHFHWNPEEAARIANLSPARQAAEIGKIEDKLSAAKPQKSGAPSPIQPIAGQKARAEKNPAEMSYKEYVAWREKSLKRR